ncbi:hypothetical protein KL943_004727 [Ogataea angusta]|nr:hypothetical protein KL943_004727 [Ogataea angusta]
MFSTLGNVTYGLQILFYRSDWDYVVLNSSWLLGSLGTIAEDLVIFAQFYMYRHADTGFSDRSSTTRPNASSSSSSTPTTQTSSPTSRCLRHPRSDPQRPTATSRDCPRTTSPRTTSSDTTTRSATTSSNTWLPASTSSI